MTATAISSRPVPLAPSSSRLARRRYQVWVGYPSTLRLGRYNMLAEARFATRADAVRWADEVWPSAELVTVTYFSILDGWQARPAGIRRSGVWGPL